MTTPTTAAVRKGPGCWRSIPARHKAAARMLVPQDIEPDGPIAFKGERRGLVILAETTDTKFKPAHNRDKYDQILNAPGYKTSEGFRGSVADYFRDQSGGQFELLFDVVGPYTAAHNMSYYGRNDEDDNDERAHELIIEMCKAADADVNFADYDWDGDGEAEEVFVVYAGKGESDTEISNYIWPHMWSLEDAETPLKLDGISINVYACSNELTGQGKIEGIGTFCHEFSHCLGFPDFYDICYDGLFGMGDFDLMSGGCYCGDGFCPVGYTAYEKMVCGWTKPIVLGSEDVVIDSIRPISEGGSTYIIYNDAHRNEYYLIENRQKTGWDSYYPAKGLLITHVDYNEEVWYNNIPNSVLSKKEAIEMGLTNGNDHQRMTLFHADNEDDQQYWREEWGYYWKTTTTTDLYPYRANDSLTTTSMPAATLFNRNADGTKLMQGAILDITQNGDKSMAFRYRAKMPVSAAIRETPATPLPRPVYTLDGRVAGTAIESLPHGIYIFDGKKVVR